MTQFATPIHGSMVALVTPMLEDGQVDWARLEQLIEWHITAGTHAISAVGTTGEASTLSMREHAEVIAQTVRLVAGRVPVIAGTGANSTSEALELTQEALHLGADAALLVTPYYNKPTQEGLYQHYKKIAESVAIPQILYNVPGRTGVDMQNETVVRLSKLEHIVGVKDATGDVARGTQLLSHLDPKEMVVYSGDDATAWELILAGARGNISVTANVAPNLMSQVCEAALAGNRAEAHRLNAQIELLHSVLFCESNPIPVKWALHAMGKIGTHVRLPLTVLAEQYHAPLQDALRTVGLLERN